MGVVRLGYLFAIALVLASFTGIAFVELGGSSHLSSAHPPAAGQLEPHDSGVVYRSLSSEVAVEPLLQIEQRVLSEPLRQGPPQFATLADYYWAENPQLMASLERAKRAYDERPGGGYRAMTLIAGTAGVGKTFLKRKIVKEDFPKADVHKIDIRELYEEWAAEGICVLRPDLAAGSLKLNQLPALHDSGSSRFREYLARQDASVFVVDSLDEIHPDDYCSTLRQISAFIAAAERPFVEVIVFGRAVAFQEFCLEQSQETNSTQYELIRLRPPRLRTTGDLSVSSWNYHTWKYELSWAPDGGKPEKMSLVAYRNWVQGGFGREQEFQSVTCTDSHNLCAEVDEALIDWATKHRIVSSTLGNLASNTLMREIVEKEALAGQPYDERRVMDAYLHNWLLRSARSHDRPSARQPQQLDLYLHLLQQVAARYLHDGLVDQQGFFPVHEDDQLVVEWNDTALSFPVVDILNRSGLRTASFREDGITRYRFRPLWVHRLLVEMHNEQCRQSHQHGGEGRLISYPRSANVGG